MSEFKFYGPGKYRIVFLVESEGWAYSDEVTMYADSSDDLDRICSEMFYKNQIRSISKVSENV